MFSKSGPKSLTNIKYKLTLNEPAIMCYNEYINITFRKFMSSIWSGYIYKWVKNNRHFHFKGITTPSVKQSVKRQRQCQWQQQHHQCKSNGDTSLEAPNRPQTHSQILTLTLDAAAWRSVWLCLKNVTFYRENNKIPATEWYLQWELNWVALSFLSDDNIANFVF